MRLRAALLAAALLGAPAVAAPAPVTAPRVAYTARTLPNGLRVYAIRDTGTPNVSVQVWYDVGAKDDPRGRSGFAHMFEHLMFKATRNLAPEQFDRLTEDVGGYNNASTDDDYTNYYEVIPANHLQRILFAEADRMASLVVEPVSFASERDVVKEELRLRILAQPYGKLLGLYYPELAYTIHPYARPGIGSLEDLQAASIADVRAFHATYYRPDNAVLVVAGNFDPAELDRWVDRYFAPIARPDRPVPRVAVTEPPRTAAVVRTVYEPNTPLPAVLMSWHVPPDRDADQAALTVLNAVLSSGENSRLYRALVYRDGLAQSAESFLDAKQATGNLVAYTVLATGKSAADGEAALRREMADLRDRPVSADELTEAKNELLTAAIRERETAEGKASVLARAVIIDGDPDAAARRLGAIGRVTAADVRRVARRYLGDAQSATIRYLPIGAKPTGAAGDAIAVPPGVVTADLAAPPGVAAVTPAPAGQRVPPPPPGSPVAAAPPRLAEQRLPNGLRLITAERRGLPIVTASLVALGGTATDPAGRAGAASLAAELLTKGTATRSATQVAAAVERLGGELGSDAGTDGAAVTLTVTSDQLDPALELLADVATHPAFAPSEIERARTRAVDAAAVAMGNPATLAGMVADRAVFGASSYGAPGGGTPASLRAISRDDLLRSYAGAWTPANAALVMVGDVTPAAARALADKHLAGWTGRAAAPPPPRPTPPAPRVVVVDMPDAGQAGVVVARPAVARGDPRYYPLRLANGVLGGGFSARLNQEIRIRRGLAYGATSGLDAGRAVGAVAVRTQTKNPSAAEVVRIVTAEMARLGAEPVPAAELAPRKAALVGEFGRTAETTEGLAGLLGGYVSDGVPPDEVGRYAAAINGLDSQAVRAAAAAELDPSRASVVVVGDAKQFVGELRRLHPTLEVIPASGLNLDGASLR